MWVDTLNMANSLGLLATSLGIAAAVGLLTGEGWRGFVIGAVLALSLWVMLLYGLYGIYKTFRVPAQQYAAAAVAAVAVGFLIFKLTHDNTLVWPPAFIVVGTGAIALSAIRRTKAEDN